MIIDLLIVFTIIFISQVLFFIYAAINETDKVTDLSYGLTFIVGGVAAYLLNFNEFNLTKSLLLLIIVIWGTRLSGYLFLRILKTGKDKRFDGIREDWKRFASFWLLQAISVFVILLPTSYVLLSNIKNELNYFSVIGGLIAILGIVIEGIADQQKFIFKSDEKNRGKWIATGLWKYSRHPNYLGEIMMWVGVFLFSLVSLNGLALAAIISPVYITILLVFVSGIPTLEKEYEVRYANNSEYQLYKNSTGVLFPRVSLFK